jgi:hypothetical protein
MAFTLKLVQGGSTLVNFVDGTNFSTLHWKPGFKTVQGQYVTDELTLDILGASNDGTAANVQTLHRALLYAKENLARLQAGQPYTPIFLNLQLPNGSYLLQSEVFGADDETLDKLLEVPVLGNIVEDVTLKIRRRWYFEETNLVQLVTAQNISNDLQPVSLSAPRGDVASPLLIRVTPGTASIEDQVLAALLTEGTLANHVYLLEADNSGAVGYTVTFGSGTAAYTDANFSNGKGAEITPANTNEAQRILWTLDGSSSKPVADQIHRVRLFLRGYELSGTGSGYKLRCRMGIKFGSTTVWGAWGDTQKTYTAGSYTTSVPLMDCGILALPDIASTLTTNFNIVIEVRGQAASASGPNVRIDCAYLLPCYEGGIVGDVQTGFVAATMANTLDATYLGAIDGNDRTPDAYLTDSSNNVAAPCAAIAGMPIFLRPNKMSALYVLTRLSSGAQTHKQAQTHVLDVWYRPRYRVVRGV